MQASSRSATLLVVGDVHRHWRDADRQFLERAGQDHVMFVGDLGDEDTDLVERIASLRAAKSVMLGNHDAWESFTNRAPTAKLREILTILGDDHLAYGLRELPCAGLSMVGARPFSWGGPSLRSPELYEALYGVSDMEGSAARIHEAARGAQHRDLIVLAHNGPTGLSHHSRDIWGKDFGRRIGGDWGDRDLEEGLALLRNGGWRVACVIAGHMHHRLAVPRGELRTRFVRRDGVIYVNAAVVPRVRPDDNGGSLAHYLRLTCRHGHLDRLEEIWVDEDGEVREAIEPRIVDA